MHPTQTSRSDQGFSIIELLVSLFVASMLIGVVYSVVVNASTVNSRTKLRAEAGSLAFKKVQDYINLDFNDISIGTSDFSYEVEDFSVEAEAVGLDNPSAKVYVEPESVVDTATTTQTVDFNQTITADSTYIAGSEIETDDYNDATGDYWREWRIADDQLEPYTYSAYTSNPNNMGSPSINLGSSQLVDTIRVYWWPNCQYGANNFRVQAKNGNANSNSGWTNIVTGLNDNGTSCGGSTRPQDIDVSSNTTPYQHWRLYIVDSKDNNFNVFTELEAYSSGAPGDIVEQRGDDASSAPGELFFSSSDLEMSQNGSAGQQSVGMIFDNITAEQGATVTNAYISFTADESDSGSVQLRVRGVDEDNASSWSGNYAVDNAIDSDNSDGRVGTSASTTWNPSAWSAGEKGPDTQVDVTAIVQEIVSRPGWAADNDMAFGVIYVSGSSKRVAERDPAPQLVIEWEESTSVTGGTYVDDDGDGDADNPTLIRVSTVIEYDAFGQRNTVRQESFIRKFGLGD